MSVARHLHTPQPRTEVDVAAAAIMAILDARIVPKTAGMIGRLSMVAGVPLAEIKRVGAEGIGYRAPLSTRRPIADETTVDPVQRRGPALHAASSRSRKVESHTDTRRERPRLIRRQTRAAAPNAK
jgi:hypothetical protein